MLFPRLAALVAFVGMLAHSTGAGDPIGCYAVIDKVVLEPSASAPTSIRIWGAFAVAQAGRGGIGYQEAQRGYLYYKVDPKDAQAALSEWTALRLAAGSGGVVGFGRRSVGSGRLRFLAERPERPDVYVAGFGVSRASGAAMAAHARVMRDLLNFPLPISPTEGAVVHPGAVNLVARNVGDAGVQYTFDISTGPLDIEASKPLAPGAHETTWTPVTRLRPGDVYMWRVWVTKGDWKGPVASTTFRVE